MFYFFEYWDSPSKPNGGGENAEKDVGLSLVLPYIEAFWALGRDLQWKETPYDLSASDHKLDTNQYFPFQPTMFGGF